MTTPPSKLVLQITSHSGDGSIIYRTVEEFPATLGRGYHNDIILSDPHVSAHHLHLDYDGENWWAKDAGSENGVFINNKLYKNERAKLSSGDILRAGRTEIRVFRPDHPVPHTVILQKTSRAFLWLSKPLNVWASFLISLMIIAGWTYLEIWEYHIAPTIAANVGLAFSLVFIWAGLWAVTGRLIKHKSHFQAHMAIASIYFAASTILWYLQSYVDFLTSENGFSVFVSYLTNITLFSFLLYGALSLATEMNKRKRTQSAVFFSAGVAAGIFLLGTATASEFEPDPAYPATLEPYMARLAPAENLGEFAKGNEALFNAEEFKPKAARKKD